MKLRQTLLEDMKEKARGKIKAAQMKTIRDPRGNKHLIVTHKRSRGKYSSSDESVNGMGTSSSSKLRTKLEEKAEAELWKKTERYVTKDVDVEYSLKA